jgi:hypothetical protein
LWPFAIPFLRLLNARGNEAQARLTKDVVMGMQTKLVVGTGAAMLALVMVATASAQTIPADPVATPLTATPEGAVQEAVTAVNAVYAGDCANTTSPANLGQFCSKFVDQRGSFRAYLAGRTFSEFNDWVFVQQTTGGWVPVGTQPFDESASPGVVPWPAA